MHALYQYGILENYCHLFNEFVPYTKQCMQEVCVKNREKCILLWVNKCCKSYSWKQFLTNAWDLWLLDFQSASIVFWWMIYNTNARNPWPFKVPVSLLSQFLQSLTQIGCTPPEISCSAIFIGIGPFIPCLAKISWSQLRHGMNADY